jgi:hypothetical protein
MNAENQENRGPREPLIFTVTAYGLIAALSLDWCSSSQTEERKPIIEPMVPLFAAGPWQFWAYP